LNRRLGIYLKERRPELTTRELLEMSHLDEWQVATPLIAALLENEDEEAAREVVEERLRAQGKLPVGGWGRALLDDQLEVCAAIAREVREQRAGAEMRTVELDLALPGLPRLEGALADAYGGALVLHGYSSLRARHQLDLWIRHVALCAASPALPSRGSVRIGRKDASASAIVFSPLAREAATHELEKLVKLYLAGQQRPLPFLPDESHDYLEKLRKGKPAREAIGAAISAYDGKEMSTVALDPHPQRAFDYLLPPFDAAHDRGERPVEDTEFHELAERVFGPCFAAKSEPSR
jgi:exodeoxyribonuclease V gamma subunit